MKFEFPGEDKKYFGKSIFHLHSFIGFAQHNVYRNAYLLDSLVLQVRSSTVVCTFFDNLLQQCEL